MPAPLLAAAALAGLAQSTVDTCRPSFGNSTFNLQPLQTPAFYMVEDSRNNQYSMNYTYFFNVCGNVNLLPNAGCATTYPGGNSLYPTLTAPAPAFQVANWAVPQADQCHRLGGPANSTANVKYGLYDTSNPSRGVYIQYTGGDRCPGVYPTAYRSLRLWLLCYNDAVNIPDEEPVLESQTCSYDIYINTIYGCPAECAKVTDPITGDINLCSNHGICDYDAVMGSSRCFCNDGFEGADCSVPIQPPAGGLSSLGGVLIAVGIFLAVTLGFLFYLWLRIKGLRLDPSAYSALRAGPEPGESVSSSAVAVQ